MKYSLKPSAASVLILFLFSSCAWNSKDVSKWFRSDKVVDDSQMTQVGVDVQEAEKFSIQEVKPPINEAELKSTKSAPVTQKQKTAFVAKQKAQAKKALAKDAKPIEIKSIYPEDYPTELKELDENSKKTWDLFKPYLNTNEKIMLNVEYLGMTVGKVVVGYRGLKMMNDNTVHHFQAFFKSAPFYSAIYEIDDQIDTFVDTESFTSKRYNLIQKESSQDVDEVQLYDREVLKTSAYQKTVKKKEASSKKWEGPIPQWYIDPLSVLWLIRGMPLLNGEVYTIPVVNKSKVLVVTATVQDREVIKIKTGKVQTIRVQASSQYTGKTLKSGDMTLWFSDDKERRLLRLQAKIKLGSIYAEYTDGK